MKEKLKQYLERFPAFYLLILKIWRWNHWSKVWLVTPHHDICIEGFPRSANSFASMAIEKTNNNRLKVATHTHSPAQVKQAVKLGIPTMVLIRNPIDAVIGDLAIKQQLENRVPAKPIQKDILSSLNRWEWFYNSIRTIRRQIFIAEFDDVIKDYRAVSQRFVGFSNTEIKPYDPEQFPPEEILGQSFHIGPDTDREIIKSEISTLVNTVVEQGGFDEALSLYNSIGND